MILFLPNHLMYILVIAHVNQLVIAIVIVLIIVLVNTLVIAYLVIVILVVTFLVIVLTTVSVSVSVISVIAVSSRATVPVTSYFFILTWKIFFFTRKGVVPLPRISMIRYMFRVRLTKWFLNMFLQPFKVPC